MKKNNTYLSLVIPAYNEEAVLDKNLKEILKFLKSKKFTWEIIIANDGSRDKTAEIASKYKNQGVRLFSLDVNQGKGSALKEGMTKAGGKYVLFMDADLSVPLVFVDKILKEFEKGYDVVVGSRRIAGSNITKHQPFLRETLGRAYTLLTKIITGVPLNDFTCGFKAFTNEASSKIFGKSVISRWAYDSEIMFLANKFGFKIGQVPVTWINRLDSRVRLGSAVTTSFKDLIRIRINNLNGVYD